MKPFVTLCLCASLIATSATSQVLFEEHFSGYNLNVKGSSHITNYTTWSLNTQCTDSMLYKYLSPLPFGHAEFGCDAWVVTPLPLSNDTVAMAAGMLRNGNYNPDRWLLLPALTPTAANTYLSWQSKNAPGQALESYQVMLATTNVSNPTSADFTTTLYNAALDTSTPRGVFHKRAVSLDAYTNQQVRIAFRYKNSTIPSANNAMMLDDIVVAVAPAVADAAFEKIDMPRYVPKGNNTVRVQLRNMGATPISSIEYGVQIDGGAVQTHTATLSPALGYMGTALVQTTKNLANAGSANIKVFITKVNGVVNTIVANDTVSKRQFVYDHQPKRKMLMEYLSGAWCVACPDEAYEVDQAYKAMDDTLLVAAVHYNDIMASAGSAGILMNTYGTNSFPSMFLSREAYIDRYPDYDFADYYVNNTASVSSIRARARNFVPVEVGITNKTYDSATRHLEFDVNATFVSDDDLPYNLNVYFTQDSCWGTGSNWNQANGGNNDPSSPYYNQGNPIQGYKHKNVLLQAVEGMWGNATVIPASPQAGQTYTKHYSLTVFQSPLAEMWHADKINIIAFVQQAGTLLSEKSIVNADNLKLTAPSPNNVQTVAGYQPIHVYPNPATSILHLSAHAAGMQYKMTDVTGRNCGAGEVSAQGLNIQSLPAGIYILQLTNGKGANQTLRFTKQ